MKITLNSPLVGPDGTPMDASMSQALANVLFSADNRENAIKLYELSMQFYKKGEAELDTADIDLVLATLKKSQLTAGAAGQIESAIKKQRLAK